MLPAKADAPNSAFHESYTQLFSYPNYVQRLPQIIKTTPAWSQLIREYAIRNGADPDRAVRIAHCESGFNPQAKNKTSTASGLFQFVDQTWKAKSQAYGVQTEKNDPYGQIQVATKMMADTGYGDWKSSQSCWLQ